MELVRTPSNGASYGDWKRSMVIDLTAKNKMCFIDGSLSKPDCTDASYRSWCRCNSMIIGWIITVLEPQIAGIILYVDMLILQGVFGLIWKKGLVKFHQLNCMH